MCSTKGNDVECKGFNLIMVVQYNGVQYDLITICTWTTQDQRY